MVSASTKADPQLSRSSFLGMTEWGSDLYTSAGRDGRTIESSDHYLKLGKLAWVSQLSPFPVAMNELNRASFC